jgi:hypothetical protein
MATVNGNNLKVQFRLGPVMGEHVDRRAREWGVGWNDAAKMLACMGEYGLGHHLSLLLRELAILYVGRYAHPYPEACRAAAAVLAEHSRLAPLSMAEERQAVGEMLGGTRAAANRVRAKVNAKKFKVNPNAKANQ